MNAESAAAPERAGLARIVERLDWIFVIAALSLVTLIYVAYSYQLITYPFDWTMDEGLYLDNARRLIESPGSLYSGRAVPVSDAYGPLFPALLVPLVGLSKPLAAARLLLLACTLAGVCAVWVLVRRRVGSVWATTAAAFYLAAFSVSSWYMLIRMDTIMVSLWLWAAVLLSPSELSRGAISMADTDKLSRGRMAGGVLLVLAAILSKPTALLHCAPLIAGWFLVNRRCAWHLSIVLTLSGLLTLLALELATGGGYVDTMLLWRTHAQERGIFAHIVIDFAGRIWPLLLLSLVGLVAAFARRTRPWREPGLLMLFGGLLILPFTGKEGACWNYLLPVYAALTVVGVCWIARASAFHPWLRRMAPSGLALAALVLTSVQAFPLPTRVDEEAAHTLYDFTQAFHRRSGGPVLASSPDLIYFLVGQDTEIEGTGFPHLYANRVPGVERVLDGLQSGRYTLLVITYPLPDAPAWHRAVGLNYRFEGVCRLGTYFTGLDSRLYVRRDIPIAFTPPSGVRCLPAGGGGGRQP